MKKKFKKSIRQVDLTMFFFKFNNLRLVFSRSCRRLVFDYKNFGFVQSIDEVRTKHLNCFGIFIKNICFLVIGRLLFWQREDMAWNVFSCHYFLLTFWLKNLNLKVLIEFIHNVCNFFKYVKFHSVSA